MDNNLTLIKTNIYNKCALEISDFKNEQGSKEYDACRFKLNGLNIISRNAKITLKKVDNSWHFGNEMKADQSSLFAKQTELIFIL